MSGWELRSVRHYALCSGCPRTAASHPASWRGPWFDRDGVETQGWFCEDCQRRRGLHHRPLRRGRRRSAPETLDERIGRMEREANRLLVATKVLFFVALAVLVFQLGRLAGAW